MYHELMHRVVSLQTIVFLSSLTTSLFDIGFVLSTDECASYRVVNDSSRSVSNTSSGGCDDSMSAIFGLHWIRFKGSGRTVIPEYAPPIHHCGANAPGWIRGAHPAVNDGIVERQLCYHFNGDECIFQYEIFIRNCGMFYVYKPPYITRCSLRVCTDIDKCFCNAIGVANQSVIPDNQMKASSFYHRPGVYDAPHYGRLHGNRGDGWCASTENGNDWLQVDLGKIFQLCGVATQGDGDSGFGDEWVTDFKLSYSLNENNWTIYEDGNGTEVEFHREGDSNTVDKHKLPVAVFARYIRFYPTQQYRWNCLRVEVYHTVVDVDECSSNNTHDCHSSANCIDTECSFYCTCNEGYTGDGRSCIDLDECASEQHNCHEHAVCSNTIGSYTCHCQSGYTGDGLYCEACPKFSRCIQTLPNSCECWCKYFYPGRPNVDACRSPGSLLAHLTEVSILDTETQPDSPITLRRDQTRKLEAYFNSKSIVDSGKASFYWRVQKLTLSPFNISDTAELLVHTTRELNIVPKLLSTGLKLVVFELQVTGTELAARDFAFLLVQTSALVVSITGGSEVFRSIDKPIVLDASFSYDLENEHRTFSGMAFNWSCFRAANKSVSGFNKAATSELFNNSRNVLNTLRDAVADGTLVQLPDDIFVHISEEGKALLDPEKLVSNAAYHVLLTVRKDHRHESAVQTVHIHDGELVDIRIMCVINCFSSVRSSSISVRTDCSTASCPKSLKYRWKMFRKSGSLPYSKWISYTNFSNFLATQDDFKNLVVKQQILVPGWSYRITVDALSPGGSCGWAAYQFDALDGPLGGTCYVTQLNMEAAVGVWLNITCHGWNDNSVPLTYEFYHVSGDGQYDMLSYGVQSSAIVHITPSVEDVVRLKINIVNVVGVEREIGLSIKVNQSLLTQSDYILHDQIKKILDVMEHYYSLGEINLAIQETDSLLALVKAADYRINETFLLQIREYVITRICRVRVDSLERLVQIAVILGKATEDAGNIFHNTTFALLDKLLEMSSLLSLLTNRRSGETRLTNNGGRSLMYCNTKIMGYISHRIFEAINSNNDKENEVTIGNRILRLCQSVTEKVTNILLSLKLPGEEYIIMKNEHQSIILGKQESHDLNQLTVQDGQASFKFPSLNDKDLKRISGNTSDVGLEMINYNFNPYTAHHSSRRVKSNVVSLVLKDDSGEALDVTDLSSQIQINIPTSGNDSGSTTSQSQTDDFLNPGSIQYHVITAREANITLKLSMTMKPPAAITAYIKFGEQPTQTSYDKVIELSEENEFHTFVSDCKSSEKCSYNILISCNASGKYYIGFLIREENRTVHSRDKRSLMSSEGESNEKCVKFKDPPPTLAPPVESSILVSQYNPDSSVNYSLQVNAIWCVYWSETEEGWTNEGCKVGQESNTSSLTCLCNHLTAFGGEVLVAPNTIDFVLVQQAFDNLDPGDLLVLITVCSAFLFYFVVLVIARRADNLDVLKDSPLIPLREHQSGEYKYEVSITTGGWKNSGTTANVSMILYGSENTSSVIKLTCDQQYDGKLFARGNTDNFLVQLEKPFGKMTSVQIGHDISGDNPSWFLKEIIIVDHQRADQCTFKCDCWLALEKDDGNTTRVFYIDDNRKDDEFKRTFSSLRRNGFSDDHLWLSVISKQPRNHFTRVQRTSCCWCLLMLSMVTSAMFYETENTKQPNIKIGPFSLASSQLIIALESAVIFVPASLLIVFLFRKSEPKRDRQGRRYHVAKTKTKGPCVLPHFCVYFAWFLCIGTAITSALFTVFYSLMWGGEKSARWLTSVVLSLSGDVIISQPIKIILVSVIIASRCGCRKKTSREFRSGREENPKPFRTALLVDVERARRYKIKERKMYAYLKELTFSLLFFALLLIVCYGDKNDQRYSLKEATESDFQYFDEKGQYKILSVTQFWGWLKNIFLPAIFTAESYHDQEEKASEYIGNMRSILIGMPRLRQLRVIKDSCEVHELFKSIITSCYDFYSIKEEEKRTLTDQNMQNTSSLLCPEDWEYNEDNKLGSFDSWGRFAVYSGGGYLANLGYNKLTAKRIIDDLMKNNWIDRQTRAVLVEFSLYNPSSNLLAVITYYYEVLPAGFSGVFKSYGILPLSATDPRAHDTYLFFAFLFGLLLVCYSVLECIKVCRQKRSYFTSVWNWLDVLQILTASSALLLQWMRSKEAGKSFEKLKGNPFVPVSFHRALFLFDAENVIICIASVIATVRLLKCFYFNPQVIFFTFTIRRSFTSLASFFVIFLVVAVGHTLLGMLAFGQSVYMFSSVSEAIFSQFLMLLGSNFPLEELKDANPIVGRLFFFTFVSSTTIILGNMFIAIINDHYVSSCADKGGEDVELAEFIMSRILETIFGQKSRKNRKWNECANHELFEPEREQPDGASSPDWTPVMYRSCTRQTSSTGDPVANSSYNYREYAVWETYGPGHLVIKSSNDKARISSSINLKRLSTSIVRFNQHISTKLNNSDDNEGDDHDDDDDDDHDEDVHDDVDDDDNDDDDDDDDDDENVYDNVDE